MDDLEINIYSTSNFKPKVFYDIFLWYLNIDFINFII